MARDMFTKRKRVVRFTKTKERSAEERMSDVIMKLYGVGPKEAWNIIRRKEMERELKAIGNV